MKIGFSKNGLTLNSKEFNPLNISIKGHGIECNDPMPKINPFELLGQLSSVKSEEVSKLDKVKVLQSVIDKITGPEFKIAETGKE